MIFMSKDLNKQRFFIDTIVDRQIKEYIKEREGKKPQLEGTYAAIVCDRRIAQAIKMSNEKSS